MDGRLAGYLGVVGLAGRGEHGARLVAGQFHDVVLAGEVAYRFPRDEASRRCQPRSTVTRPAWTTGSASTDDRSTAADR
jgi:hypothetical protein